MSSEWSWVLAKTCAIYIKANGVVMAIVTEWRAFPQSVTDCS